MKWIGQNIWSLISRFRSDVYLEELDDIAQPKVLGVDTNGKIHKFDTPSGGGGASTLNELTDVDTTGAISGDLIKFNGSSWEDFTPTYLEGATTPTTGDIAYFDSNGDIITETFGFFKFNAATFALDISAVNTLRMVIPSNFSWLESSNNGDVVKIGQSTPATDDYLKWDGSKAIWSTVTSGAVSLSELDDVTVSNPPNDNDILKYNAATSKWENEVDTGGVGGSNTQVQFNDNGTLEGTSLLTIDEANGDVVVNGNIDITGSANALTVNSTTGNTAIHTKSTDPDCLIRVEDNSTASSNVLGLLATGNDISIRNDEGSFNVKMANNTTTTLSLNQSGNLAVEGEYAGKAVALGLSTPVITSKKIYNNGGELTWEDSVISRTDKISLTSTQYQNLGTTGVILVPAPGVNKHIVVHSVFIKAKNSASPETRAETAYVGHVVGSTSLYFGSQKDFLRAMPATTTWTRQIQNNNDNLSNLSTSDRAVYLYASGGFTGSVSLEIAITYSIIRL